MQAAPNLNSHLTQLSQTGFSVVPDPIFSESDFLNLKNYLFRYLDTLPERHRPTLFMSNPYLPQPALSDWVGAPPIVSLLQPLLGPDLLFVHASMCYKPPRSEYRVPLHADSFYSLLYGTFEPGSVVNLFFAITDCSLDNGPIRFIPEALEDKIYKHRPTSKEFSFFAAEIDDPEVDSTKLRAVPLAENHACLFSHSVVHDSPCNTSDRPRLGVTLRYTSAAIKIQDGANYPQNIFLISGENKAGNRCLDPASMSKVGGFSWSPP